MQKVIVSYLRHLKIPVSRKYFEKHVLSHPDYPSLLSIADTFERLGIKYNAWRSSREQLNEIPFPYLLLLKIEDDGGLLFVKNQHDLTKSEKKLSFWEGVVLKAEAKATIDDQQNNLLYRTERIVNAAVVVLLGVCLGHILLPFLLYPNLLSISLGASSLLGVTVGVVLVAKDLGIKYNSIESFCNSGKNASCDKILHSDDLNLFGALKLSDAVLVYFIFQIVLLSISGYIPESWPIVLTLIFSLSNLTIPVIILSIYYQYVKVKIWCKLCMVVNAVLALQFILITFSIDSFRLGDLSALILLEVSALFATIASVVILIKNLVDKFIQPDIDTIRSNRIKNLAPVFTHLLKLEKSIDSTPFRQEILIGDPNAPVKIIMASNLYCKPCKEQHKNLSKLVATYPTKVNLTIRFLLSGSDVHRKLTTNQYLLQYWSENIYGRHQESQNSEELIHNWFSIMELEKFRARFPIRQEVEDTVKELEKLHLDWIKASQVTQTPTIFINGYRFPRDYDFEDLMSLVPGIAEYFTKLKKYKDSLLLAE